MELKPHQLQVVHDLERYLECLGRTNSPSKAFDSFWRTNNPALIPAPDTPLEPYKDNIPGVPHICIKVPTAGGKTFIACNALKTIFGGLPEGVPRFVVWLVPSLTILEQTFRNLRDSSHPYRAKINAHFGNRVEVLDKVDLLNGLSFNTSSIIENLTILLLSFDSLRARNKDDRKIFQENPHMASFHTLLHEGDDLSAANVMKRLRPVVIVDESHNAESDLSIEMLQNLNPSFILDLTATPRKNSNIISFVDALQLKKETMVKLPVIVSNQNDRTGVIHAAIELQKNLEIQAVSAQAKGGPYIRPIVLFQAQPRNRARFMDEADERSNIHKLKDKLIEVGIPPEQIRIKSAAINELKDIDLMKPECPVRYIITINALKEGWDCPFAYILASLADRSSPIEVEQVLGRILRQPYTSNHSTAMLNMSFVLTASSRFNEAVQSVIEGLQRAGFSDKDYKLGAPLAEPENPRAKHEPEMQSIFPADDEDVVIDIKRIQAGSDTPAIKEWLDGLVKVAAQQEQLLENKMEEISEGASHVPQEIQRLMKTYPVKERHREEVAQLLLPQFFLRTVVTHLFSSPGMESERLLDKENLLEDFPLGNAEVNVALELDSETFEIDLDESRTEHTPSSRKINRVFQERIESILLDPSRHASRVRNFTSRLMSLIGKQMSIPDKELEKYLGRLLSEFSDSQFHDLVSRELSYAEKIKEQIRTLGEAFAEKRFREQLDSDKILVKPNYQLPSHISPAETGKDISNSLYEKEGKLNGFEERVIHEVANMPNILFWTKNLEKTGFRINGFINHYPDFIIRTRNNKTVVLETKGDHLYAEKKLSLGKLWAAHAGNNFRYFLVYDRRQVNDAHTLDAFLKIIRDL